MSFQVIDAQVKREHQYTSDLEISRCACDGDDWDAVSTILTESGLPIPNEKDNEVTMFILQRDGIKIGCAGWERYGNAALLRSVAIRGDCRNAENGSYLIRNLLKQIANDGVLQVVLLTNSAERFFQKLGFVPIDRDSAPPGVRSSQEFKMDCCRRAQCMELLF